MPTARRIKEKIAKRGPTYDCKHLSPRPQGKDPPEYYHCSKYDEPVNPLEGNCVKTCRLYTPLGAEGEKKDISKQDLADKELQAEKKLEVLESVEIEAIKAFVRELGIGGEWEMFLAGFKAGFQRGKNQSSED